FSCLGRLTISPRLRTVVSSVIAFGFGWHGASGCSALLPVTARMAGIASANTEQDLTFRPPVNACGVMTCSSLTLWWTGHILVPAISQRSGVLRLDRYDSADWRLFRRVPARSSKLAR